MEVNEENDRQPAACECGNTFFFRVDQYNWLANRLEEHPDVFDRLWCVGCGVMHVRTADVNAKPIWQRREFSPIARCFQPVPV
jgi:hypothetical protein